MQRLLGPGVDPHPQVGELVGGDELADLPVDQAVDRRRQRPDQLLQTRPVGDHPGEDAVEDGLDVDLLLDRLGDLGGDDVLHLGRGDERIHGGDVALGVVQGALTPVRHGRGHGQEAGQHDADRPRRPSDHGRPLRCWRRFAGCWGYSMARAPTWRLRQTCDGVRGSGAGQSGRSRPRAHRTKGTQLVVPGHPGGHLWATDPRGPLTPPPPFGLFIFIELSEWIFLNG